MTLLGAPAALAALASGAHASETEDHALLEETWAAYRTRYILPSGRVVDPHGGDRSTSEGQAYALVRALVVGDPATFERVRLWTVDNLQHGDPTHLPAWHWGQRADGQWGILDEMPAADADEWMAWALFRAARVWSRPDYRSQALGLAGHIWDAETMLIAGQRVLLPGPWAKTTAPVRLNPSYWLPFAWRVFAEEDTAHDWKALIDPAYKLFEACKSPYGLPPDWCHVDATSGLVTAPTAALSKDADFGFEAFRVAWTLAAEVLWYKEPRANSLLADFNRLARRWKGRDTLPAVIGPHGVAQADYAYQGMYGALLPAWSVDRPARSNALWHRTISPTRTDTGWGSEADYYGQNWIWLGFALWRGSMTAGGPA